METESGLYTGEREDSFKSLKDIQIESLQKGNISILYPDRDIPELSFNELTEEFTRRGELRRKVENKECFARVEIQTDKPLGLIWWSDVHTGGTFVDYELLKYEADRVKENPYLRIALGGDFANSFVWAGGANEDIANINEQTFYLYRLLDYVGWDKVLFGVIGNHQNFLRKNGGLDGYADIRRRIPMFDGVGTVVLSVNGIEYNGAIIHKPRGNSYLDPNFGGKRFLRENDGYDFVMTAHLHEGAGQTISRKGVFGEREVALLAGKTFKATDSWHDIESFKRKSKEGLGSNGIIFDCVEKDMLVVNSFNKMLKYI